jgi:hypothetical protein
MGWKNAVFGTQRLGTDKDWERLIGSAAKPQPKIADREKPFWGSLTQRLHGLCAETRNQNLVLRYFQWNQAFSLTPWL